MSPIGVVGVYSMIVNPQVEGAGHNDVELYSQYLDRLKRFITVELTT